MAALQHNEKKSKEKKNSHGPRVGSRSYTLGNILIKEIPRQPPQVEEQKSFLWDFWENGMEGYGIAV